jgi:hypothetical protein
VKSVTEINSMVMHPVSRKTLRFNKEITVVYSLKVTNIKTKSVLDLKYV